MTFPKAVMLRSVVARVESVTMSKPKAMPIPADAPPADPSAEVFVAPVWVAVAEKLPVRVSKPPAPKIVWVSLLTTDMPMAPPMPTPDPPVAAPPALAVVVTVLSEVADKARS